ncbi:MAG: hypothetical protein KF722_14055 [Nitrospira sp.]|nr:hypothetical protein [Nitrospira sp.]
MLGALMLDLGVVEDPPAIPVELIVANAVDRKAKLVTHGICRMYFAVEELVALKRVLKVGKGLWVLDPKVVEIAVRSSANSDVLGKLF